MKPLKDKVLIEPIKYKGNIVLVHEKKPTKGTVIEVGEGVRLKDGTLRALEVKKGDIVLFLEYKPEAVKYKNKEYYIIKESDILAKL